MRMATLFLYKIIKYVEEELIVKVLEYWIECEGIGVY
jgi:hypothetical protein